MTPWPVTAVVGEPCTGKSTLFRALLSHGTWEYRPGRVPHHESLGLSALVLGRYDEEHRFPGTDRLSMSIQPKALEFVASRRGQAILFEGDRLGNRSMFEALTALGADLEVLVLSVRPEGLQTRRAAERGDQSERFVCSRATKVANLLGSPFVRVWPHDDPADTRRLVDYLLTWRM